jgi:triphosphoribosyl-dephospho-CoA synthase
VAAAAEAACLFEVQAPKPGNVGRGHDRPGLTYRDFVLSAAALGIVFRRRARGRIGNLVLETVRATRRHVPTNTNLGIVLLLAPLAKAALAGGTSATALRPRLRRILRDLDVRDARQAYAAIRLAHPGGLGTVREQDVRSAPTATLLACMRLAAGHDAVAREYATGYAVTFGLGVPALRKQRAAGASMPRAIVETYLRLLARHPDTLIARRHGAAAARAVSRSAAAVLRAGATGTAQGRRRLLAFDRRLRGATPPLNPGATADLVAASLFVWFLEAIGKKKSPATTRSRRRR